MLVGRAIQKMHRRYAGDFKYPVVNSDTWNGYLEILNDKKEDFARDGDNNWRSTWEERTFGTVADGTVDYELDDDVFKLSDYVYLDIPSGQTLEYKVIEAKDRYANRHQYCVYQSGETPVTMHFTYLPANAVGATIRAGIHFVPPDMKKANDTVPIDRPSWAILAGAAELALNDPSKEDKFPDLNGLANDDYQMMVDKNKTLPGNQVSSVPIVGFIQPGGSRD